jgi:hypothetical protein
MSKDNSDLNGCAWALVIGGILLAFLLASGGGGGSSSSSRNSSGSPSGGSLSDSSSSPRIDSHESYIRASEAERQQWAAEKEAELRRKGINSTSAKDLKDAMDAFYSR